MIVQILGTLELYKLEKRNQRPVAVLIVIVNFSWSERTSNACSLICKEDSKYPFSAQCLPQSCTPSSLAYSYSYCIMIVYNLSFRCKSSKENFKSDLLRTLKTRKCVI